MKKNKYKISYIPLFYSDLENIIKYITYELGNQRAAKNLLQNIEKAILKRSENLESFEIYEGGNYKLENWYRIYVGNYTIFYVIIDDCMEVRRMLYSRRILKDIFRG